MTVTSRESGLVCPIPSQDSQADDRLEEFTSEIIFGPGKDSEPLVSVGCSYSFLQVSLGTLDLTSYCT